MGVVFLKLNYFIKILEQSIDFDPEPLRRVSQLLNKFGIGKLGNVNPLLAQVSVVQKLLGELARDPGSGKFKDLQQQRDDQQLPPIGSNSSWGGGNGAGANS